jgi:hypothetical protein
MVRWCHGAPAEIYVLPRGNRVRLCTRCCARAPLSDPPLFSMAQIGDMYRLPDRLTGFSTDLVKERWCMVVHVDRFSVRVVPRTASDDPAGAGVYVPKEAMSRFTKNGRFYDDFRSIPTVTLRDYQPAEPLPAEYRDRVVKQYRDSQQRRRDLRRNARRAR